MKFSSIISFSQMLLALVPGSLSVNWGIFDDCSKVVTELKCCMYKEYEAVVVR
jgi:hypothetical protein